MNAPYVPKAPPSAMQQRIGAAQLRAAANCYGGDLAFHLRYYIDQGLVQTWQDFQQCKRAYRREMYDH